MSERASRRVYDLWAKVYDGTFGKLVHKRQVAAIERLNAQPGDRVLDLGVGTGMTLGHYPKGVTVVGLDLSAGMLAKAAEKCRQEGLSQRHLVLADALHPPLAERSFDHVIINHTISVVSDPPALLRWASRLVRPGGRVVVLNHFRSTHPVMGRLERWANPLCLRIGWKSDLELDECLRGIDLHLHERLKLSTPDLWQIVVLGTEPAPTPRVAHAARLTRAARSHPQPG